MLLLSREMTLKIKVRSITQTFKANKPNSKNLGTGDLTVQSKLERLMMVKQLNLI